MGKFLLVICLLAALRGAAQTCTGGLGDPIVNITFGQGTSFGPALAPGVTNLVYQAADCPSDGYYTITSHTSNCFGGTWFPVAQDHTGNPNGYFMLINASYQPNEFYVQTVSGLCGNTSYQFAAWVLNMVSKPYEILPNITFTIEKTDGTVLQSYATGDIPETGSPAWKQYAFYFNTPPGVNSVVLRMMNDQIGGDGNDLALDDITFRPSGASITNTIAGFPTDTVNLCVNAQPTLNIAATVENCYPSEAVQWQQSVDSGKTWNNISGAITDNISRAPTSAGVYFYRLTVAQTENLGIATCEVESRPVEVNVIPIPSPAVSIALASDTICAGQPVVINATPVDGGASPFYQWKINSIPAGGDSAVLTGAPIHDGDVVIVSLTSDATCVVNPSVYSNAITVPIIAIPSTAVSIAASATQICADSVVVFTATPVNGGASPTYQWQINGAPAGGDSAVFADARLHNGDVVNCIMTADLVCSQPAPAVEAVPMTIYSLPVIVLDSDTVIAGGSSLQLQPSVTGDLADFSWTPTTGMEDAGSLTPVVKPVSTTAYTLRVITMDGCTAVATENVEVFYDVRLPEAFTPNGDGRNDIFRVPPSIPVSIRRFAIYNRQGQMVFYTTNAGEGWDGFFKGQLQPAGVYVWYVEYNDPLSKTVGQKQGTVILVR